MAFSAVPQKSPAGMQAAAQPMARAPATQMQQAAPSGGGALNWRNTEGGRAALLRATQANSKRNSGQGPDALYKDLLAQDDAAWGEKQKGLQDQMGLFQRQAQNLNARTGGTIAGGYASMTGAALGKGMQAYNQGAQEHGDRRRQLMLAWLDKKMQGKNRAEERSWQLSDMASQQAHEIDLERMRNMGTTPDMNAYGGAGGAGEAPGVSGPLMPKKDDGTYDTSKWTRQPDGSYRLNM